MPSARSCRSRTASASIVRGKATILCTGGTGQLYRYTTNPEVATGDGIAMAYRAGADIRDMEFVQFHPTSLCYPGAPRFLISEAVRGEGAVLRNIQRRAVHGEISSSSWSLRRGTSSRGRSSARWKRRSRRSSIIDITHESADMVKHRFPTIYEYCLQYGLDLTTDWIPVAPAAHYMMGGVKTDLNGETNIARLFACGEVLVDRRARREPAGEQFVVGSDRIRTPHRGAHQYARACRARNPPHMRFAGATASAPIQAVVEKRLKLQKIMVRYAGLRRDAQRA